MLQAVSPQLVTVSQKSVFDLHINILCKQESNSGRSELWVRHGASTTEATKKWNWIERREQKKSVAIITEKSAVN